MPLPPPPYTPSQPLIKPSDLSALPLPIIFKIVSYTLDPHATPNRWITDLEEEKVRRIWGLFIGLRGVCRSFWLVSTSILRTTYHPPYLNLIQPGYSSDAYPHDSHPSYFDSAITPASDSKEDGPVTPASTGKTGSVLAGRSRETAVFDRWIAIRVGEELRSVESSLSEESGAAQEIFSRFQPVARIEDLLPVYIPITLVKPRHTAPDAPTTTLPLPHTHLSVTLTPSWCQLWIWAMPYGRGRNGKDMVLEVRRQETLEGTVKRLGEGLADMGEGLVQWGGRML